MTKSNQPEEKKDQKLEEATTPAPVETVPAQEEAKQDEKKEDSQELPELLTSAEVKILLSDFAAQFSAEMADLKSQLEVAQSKAEASEKKVERLSSAQEAALENGEASKLTSKNLEKELENDRARMQAKLDAQPKVRTIISTNGNEVPGKALEFVSINGYEMWIPKGVFVYVPIQVADMLAEYQHIPEMVGQEFRLDLESGKAERLSQ